MEELNDFIIHLVRVPEEHPAEYSEKQAGASIWLRLLSRQKHQTARSS